MNDLFYSLPFVMSCYVGAAICFAIVLYRLMRSKKCPHKKTVILNEEGYAGKFCVDCGEQLSHEC